MRPRNATFRRPPRECRPTINGLESRDLPSGGLGGTKVVHIPPTAAPSFDPPSSPVKSVYHEPLVPNLALIPQFQSLAYPAGTPQPTPSEINREYFVAKFAGRYDVYPGRMSYQALTIHGISKDGGTNQSLRSRMQFVIFPTVAGAAEPLLGQAAFFPQNYLQTGGLLILDLSGAPAGEATGQSAESGSPQNVGNGISLPTHLHWYLDGNSGGSYTAPVGFTQSGGYMDLVWLPDKTPVKGTLSSGRVIVLYQGLINNSSILNPIDPKIT